MSDKVYDNDFYSLPKDYSQKNMSYLVLVIYDISENKRRDKLFKILEGYGKSVQKSAFECFINSKQLNEIINKCLVHINKEKDSLRIYKLSGTSEKIVFGIDVTIYDKRVYIV